MNEVCPDINTTSPLEARKKNREATERSGAAIAPGLCLHPSTDVGTGTIQQCRLQQSNFMELFFFSVLQEGMGGREPELLFPRIPR